MRLLITGGAGFIGSHIAEAALDHNWEVVCIDDLSSGRRQNVPPGATLIEADIRDASRLRKAFADFRPNAVSHQAAQVSVPDSVRDPVNDAAINVIGSLHVLQAAREFKLDRFVAASSGGALYGELADGVYATENTTPTPISPYAGAKLSMESYMRIYQNQYGLETCALRYANVYGERQDANGEAGVVAIFSNRVSSGAGVKLHARVSPGDGGCIRDYIHVSDAVRANIMALAGDLPLAAINVCSGIETTTEEILEQLQRIAGRRVEVEQLGPRPGDIHRSAMSNSLCNEHLAPAMPLSEGLERTISWFQQQLKFSPGSNP